jgi:hypothetical protein
MTASDLERQLLQAKERVARASGALRAKYPRGDMEELRAALHAQTAAERALSLSRGEPTCMPLDWKPLWDIGAPSPHVVSSGHRTFLIYLVAESPRAGIFSEARMIDPSAGEQESLALVEFKGCYGYRFGGPNDEVIRGHPLYGHGLEAYGAHVVENSPWIATEMATNSVHPGFRRERWDRRKHYLLFFHDNVFECLAEGWTVEAVAGTFRQLVDLAVERMFASR